MNSGKGNSIFVFALCVLLQCITCSPLIAQDRGNKLGGGSTNYSNRREDSRGLRTGYQSVARHMVGVYAIGAYSTTLFNDAGICQLPTGYAFGGGICYDLQRYFFRMQIGLGVRVQDMKTSVGDLDIYDNAVSDAWGYPYHLKYEFRNREDLCQNIHLQIPVLFGAGDRNLYALAGFKVNLNCYNITKSTAIASTSATYDQFFGEFVEMDNHGLRKDVPIHFSETKTLRQLYPIDILASVEVGAEWGTEYTPNTSLFRPEGEPIQEMQWRIRIAAFCDFGLIPFGRSASQLVEIPQSTKWDFCTFKMNNVLEPFHSSHSHVHNFYLGLKLTLSIGSVRCEHCRLLDNFQSEWDMQNPYRKTN